MKRWSEGAFRSHFSLYPEAHKWMVGRVFETTAWANLTYLSKKTFIYRLCMMFSTHCCFYFVYFSLVAQPELSISDDGLSKVSV